jgi:nucleoside-diphosphate-sugar epimerase
VGAQLWLVARDEEKLAAICDAFEIKGQLLAADCAKQGIFSKLHSEAHPDVVFNLAGYGVDPSEKEESLAWALNLRLVEEMADAVACCEGSDWPGLRLVHAGPGADYGPVEGVLDENSDTAPVSLYGRSKLAGTNALSAARRRTGLRAITARLFTVYGPGEHAGRLLPSILSAAQSEKELELTAGQQERDFTFVGEAAEGLIRLALLEGQIPDVVNLATGKLTSVRAFTECAAEVIGLKASQLHFGVRPGNADEVRQGPVDTHQLRELLGWSPELGVRDGIAQTASFEAHCSAVRT